MRAHHVIHVDILEHLDVTTLCFSEQPSSDRVFVNHHLIDDVLAAINNVGGLQPLVVQPPQMRAQQLAQVVECQSSL